MTDRAFRLIVATSAALAAGTYIVHTVLIHIYVNLIVDIASAYFTLGGIQ